MAEPKIAAPGLPDRGQLRHRAVVGTGHRRPAQHHRAGRPERHGDHLGITSTVSGGGDQGADPNKLVAITDQLSTSAPSGESFQTLQSAASGEVLRGVSFTPGTQASGH